MKRRRKIVYDLVRKTTGEVKGTFKTRYNNPNYDAYILRGYSRELYDVAVISM
ncbi:MAG: hypothetical protein Q4A56_03535 [Porphyromonadaceae bacterium]|nr:hypothetical protein [Porphyromonadaceae bacterium]